MLEQTFAGSAIFRNTKTLSSHTRADIELHPSEGLVGKILPGTQKRTSAALLTQVVELKPGGKDIPVTTANRIAYIHLVADYRLNKQIRPHCLAFRQGLANVVNLEWLRMFDQQELQVRRTRSASV